jgi:hypothetical protein
MHESYVSKGDHYRAKRLPTLRQIIPQKLRQIISQATTVLAVHHRQPGVSSLDLLVTLCPACHAVVERTEVLFRDVPELLRVLWRELHPEASEQLPLFS